MKRLLLALAAGVTLGGCALLDPSAEVSSPQAHADRDYITGSRLPARNHNVSGTKIIQLNPIDRQDMFEPKATPIQGN